jgi:hypothetical protein
MWAWMFHVLRATCYKVGFTREFEDFGGGRADAPCATCYKLGYIVTKLHSYNGADGGKG